MQNMQSLSIQEFQDVYKWEEREDGELTDFSTEMEDGGTFRFQFHQSGRNSEKRSHGIYSLSPENSKKGSNESLYWRE